MRVATAAIAVLLGLAACAQPPTRTGVEEVERARDIADQVDDRSADLEEIGSEGD
jgi:hypothetical protein